VKVPAGCYRARSSILRQHSLHLGNPEVSLRLPPCLLISTQHVDTMSDCWVILKLNYNFSWKRLDNNAFETKKTALSIVLDHSYPRALPYVQITKAVCYTLSGPTRERIISSFTSKGRVAEIGHGAILTTSLNWN